MKSHLQFSELLADPNFDSNACDGVETKNLENVTDALPNAPLLSPIPPESSRLIDEGLMHFEASLAGYAERHSRGETSHTLHVWWARRPHSAMRALVFASLCKETSTEHTELMTKLVGSNVGDDWALAAAEATLLRQYGRPPKLLDIFGGGGTIPLEGVNLGAVVSATDINELSVFIQKCHLEYVAPQRAKFLSSVIAERGHAILSRLKNRTDLLYPLRTRKLSETSKVGPIAYLWSYSYACPSCSYRIFLSKRRWLTKKNGKALRLSFKSGADKQEVYIEHAPAQDQEKEIRDSKGLTCPKCSIQVKYPSIKNCRDEVMSLVLKKEGVGKEFVLPTDDVLPSNDAINLAESAALKQLGCSLPSSKLPVWSGIVNPALYGVETHAEFLNPRQRAVLLMLLAELHVEYKSVTEQLPENEAKFVLGTLSGLVDQLVDWNCRLSMWIPQNEQVGRAFCGPGIAMLWDYAEADPLLDGPANLWSKLERLVSGIDALLLRRGSAKVFLARAQALPFPDDEFDAIVTDPPYYDNIYYNILADFFFAWKRIILSEIEPSLFSTLITAGGGKHELVASSVRSGGASAAHTDYCYQLSLALNEASRVLRPDGVLSFVYSHASFAGWCALIQAFRNSNLRVTSAQPLSIERKARPRAIGSEAVNTCITFIARKSLDPKPMLREEEAIQALKAVVTGGFSKGLEIAGWRPEDAAMALFAQGVGLLAASTGVVGTTDEKMLEAFESEVRKLYSGFRIKKRGSL